MYIAYWFNPDGDYGCRWVTPEYAEWMQYYGDYIRCIFMVPGTLDHELGE